MSETQLDTTEEMYRVGKTVVAVVAVSFISSQFIHELGHAIALNLIGIFTTFLFEIRAVGPVFIAHGSTFPTTVTELTFVIAAGGGFAAIVFALLGRFWRIECYTVAAAQAFYTIFELVSWMVGLQAGQDLAIFYYFFAIVPIPVILVTDRIANRIVRAKYFS